MKEEFEDIITIDGEDFVVVDELSYENEKYIYVISSENEERISILKETEEDGEKYIESISRDKLELFMGLFARKFIKESKKANE